MKEFLFDIPPPTEQQIAAKQQREAEEQARAKAQGQNGNGYNFASTEDNLPPPAIEETLSWEKAQEQLPEHEQGGVDWNAALDQSLVRPRSLGDQNAAAAAAFQYDFIIEAKKEKFNALFSHSAHTGWLGCKNCHTAIYPLRRNPASMKEMRKGASCGSCHGQVAFSLKQCKRCHINM